MPEVRCRRGDELTAAELHALLQLRVAIFVVEQECAYQEIDGRDLDPTTEHLWIEDDQGVTAAVRVLADRANGPTAVKVGRVVTRADRRGEQLAARLIQTAHDRLGPVESRLEAQSHLVGYYGNFGYVADGPEYIEDDIPHTPMFRPAPTVNGATT